MTNGRLSRFETEAAYERGRTDVQTSRKVFDTRNHEQGFLLGGGLAYGRSEVGAALIATKRFSPYTTLRSRVQYLTFTLAYRL